MIRLVDIILSLILLVALAPLLIGGIFLAWIDTRSPFFFQKRVGQYERPFILIKLRTMKIGQSERPTHEVSGASISTIGQWLRRYKIDEIPQLVNVILGDMSLVGPRPSLMTQTDVIKCRTEKKIYELKPGITGLAQINQIDMSRPRELAHFDSILRVNHSLTMYVKILIYTLFGYGFGDNWRN